MAGRVISVLFCFVMLSACARFNVRRSPASSSAADDAKVIKELPTGESRYGSIPKDENKYVTYWIHYFQTRGRKYMERYLERSTSYMPLMKKVLREHGVPEDLIFIPLIESGFSSSAFSHASAVGYWQFIRSTGKRYGLQINALVDERRDPVRSTEAAAEFFKSLYNLFGDWYLALAAYNVGENRVERAVMRYKTRDFWYLVRHHRLPRETCNYVPKFLAARIISKHPADYGFRDVDYHPQLHFDVIDVTQPISLVKLAKELNLDYKDLRQMNPSYRSDFVPIYRGKSSRVRVPRGYMKAAYAVLDKVHADHPTYIAQSYFYYRIHRGDNLSVLARRYHTRIAKLRQLNHLRRHSLLHIGHMLKVPERFPHWVKYTAQKSQPDAKHFRVKRVIASTSRLRHLKYHYYRVRRGDTLSEIAERHGVSLSRLRRLNRLGRRSLLRVGQKLKIPELSDYSTKDNTDAYTVRKGDTLISIANNHHVSLSDLMRLNHLRRHAMIRVGQQLRVPSKQIHVVHEGDTLIEISHKYGVSVKDLMSVNDIDNKSKIYVGARLVIPD